MTITALPKRQFLTLNILDIVLIISIEFDDLTHLKKICMIIHSWLKCNSLSKTYSM